MHMETQKQKIIDLARKKGMLKTSDIFDAGLHHETLRRLCEEGILEKTVRGVYKLANQEISIYHDLAVASTKAPRGVVCLLSALLYHEISTQLPPVIWMAFNRDVRVPKLENPKLKVVRFSESSMAEGIDIHNIEYVSVRITNPAKTIADCFKFRNKVGLEATLDALRDGLNEKKCTRDEIWYYAKINRVTQVIKPYLEAIV